MSTGNKGEGELWSPEVQVGRTPARGGYDRAVLYPILDEAFYCHVGFAVDDQPYVIPMVFGRDGDTILLHGAPASRLGMHLLRGNRLCLSFLTLSSIVLTRSVLNHTVNYRSAVVLGTATEIKDLDRKREAAQVLLEHIVPGRWDHTRPPSIEELKGTRLLEVPIVEASTKIRSTPPFDEPEDRELPFWAGEIPMTMVPGTPLPGADVPAGVDVPAHASRYRRPPAEVREPGV